LGWIGGEEKKAASTGMGFLICADFLIRVEQTGVGTGSQVAFEKAQIEPIDKEQVSV